MYFCLLKQKSVVQIWLSRYYFEKNVINEAKNNDSVLSNKAKYRCDTSYHCVWSYLRMKSMSFTEVNSFDRDTEGKNRVR